MSSRKTSWQKPASLDALTETTRQGTIELSEEQLARVAGGAVQRARDAA